MSTKAPPLQRTRCSAKSLLRKRNPSSYKDLPFHGVEDGLKNVSMQKGPVATPGSLSRLDSRTLPRGCANPSSTVRGLDRCF
jgi:hypothetical protein